MQPSSQKSEFKVRLRDARLEKGLSQAELAQKTGLQPSAVSHFESGRRAPSFDNLRVLADALGVTTDHLLGRESRPGMAGPTAAKLFRRAEQLSSRDQEILAEFAETLAKKRQKEDKE
jgi:transcriptional regulator with XRE-family HTH domain